MGGSESSSLKPVVGECNHICNMCTYCIASAGGSTMTKSVCVERGGGGGMWEGGGGMEITDWYCGG